MIIRKFIFLKTAAFVFIFIFLSFSSMAQEDSSQPSKEVQNSLYLELLGNGIIYSLNYERMIGDPFSVRLGASYFDFFGPISTFPLLFNYNNALNENLSLQLGLGTTFVFEDENHVIPTSYIGLKVFDNSNKFYKIGLTPFKENFQSRIIISGGLSFGAGF